MNCFVYVECKNSPWRMPCVPLKANGSTCTGINGGHVSVRGKKRDRLGMTIEFIDVRAIVDEVLSQMGLLHINEVPPFDTQNPTAELIAACII